MANPKRRTSKRRRDMRRSHDAITAVATSNCSNCGALVRPHRVCGECGYYAGRQVVEVAEA
ncbi:MAG: 50S ribosomal protein L32 [Acidobacteria bacterium]|nr:50S ribosomal protein L32 [Acidobacteriota bacterium]